MTHKFKVGQLVRIKKDAAIGLVNAAGKEMLGTIQKITEIKGEEYYTGNAYWFEDELKPVTKSLEELEVGDKMINKYGSKFVIEDIKKTTEYLISYGEDGSGGWHTVEYLKSVGSKLYTPKKITVFKHKGKRYPVKEIEKKVKPILIKKIK